MEAKADVIRAEIEALEKAIDDKRAALHAAYAAHLNIPATYQA